VEVARSDVAGVRSHRRSISNFGDQESPGNRWSQMWPVEIGVSSSTRSAT
jgi:hypothetical protein